jgi:hypothetical protein
LNAWTFLSAASLVAAVALAAAGCYKPAVTDGGFACAATGVRCPEGYTCAADNHCWINPSSANVRDGGQDGAIDTKPLTDAGNGGDSAMCTAPPTALCDQGPAAGEACSPACQKGCSCGRCNVVGGQASCVAAGSVQLGELCNANADNCAAGLTCLPETCGNGLARCYRLCTSKAQCGDTACTITLNSNSTGRTYTTCDVPTYACDPVTGGGCPSPAFNCYLASADRTVCDCPTRPAAMGGLNAECSYYSQCAAGFVCISVSSLAKPQCQFVCEVSKGGCPTGSHCAAMGSSTKYGFCAQDN